MAVVLVLVLALLGGLVLLVGVRTLQPVLGDDAGVRVVYPHPQVVELPIGSSLEEVRFTCESRRKMGGCMNWEHKLGGGWGRGGWEGARGYPVKTKQTNKQTTTNKQRTQNNNNNMVILVVSSKLFTFLISVFLLLSRFPHSSFIPPTLFRLASKV